MSVFCVADTDSRLKWARCLAARLASSAGPVTANVLLSNSVELSDRQVAELGLDSAPLMLSPLELGERARADEVDVLVVCLPGSGLMKVRLAIEQIFGELSRRPVLVTGYAGVVYEKHTEGILWRSGYDVICVNSRRDERLFGALLRGAGLDSSPLVRAGFPVLDRAVQRPARERTDARFTMTFAIQPDVPETRSDRLYVTERLARYAQAHPDRRVIVKMRARPNEHTTHREIHRYETMVGTETERVPTPNLEVVYGPMDEVLDETDLLVTVSSTAAMEAWARGIGAAIVMDFGVAERYGNHYFLGCGALTTFDHLEADAVGPADPAWLLDNGIGDPPVDVDAVVADLLARQAADGRRLDWRAPFYSPQRTPLVVERHAASGPAAALGRRRRFAPARRAVKTVLHGPIGRSARRIKRWAEV